MQRMIGIVSSALALATSAGAAELFPPEAPHSMVFALAKPDRDCVDCSWISAEGPITSQTPDDWLAFKAFLARSDLRGMRVHLNSQGGSLRDALRLGDLFRLEAVTTVASATTGERDSDGTVIVAREDGTAREADPDARCVSACVIAFAGGVKRIAAASTSSGIIGGQDTIPLAVHAFSYQTGTGSADPDALEITETPAGSPAAADLLDYFTRVGVSSEVLQLATLVPQPNLLDLSDDRIRRVGLDTHLPTRLEVVGYANGVGVVEADLDRPSGRYALELYCSGGTLKMLAKARLDVDLEATEARDLGVLSSLHLGKDALSIERLDLERTDHALELDALISFQGIDIASLVTRTDFAFADETSDFADAIADDLSFGLPDGYGGLFVLPPTCQG